MKCNIDINNEPKLLIKCALWIKYCITFAANCKNKYARNMTYICIVNIQLHHY